VGPVEAAAATIATVLADHPEVASRRLDATRWSVVLPGQVRLAIPVGISVAQHTTTLSSFVLRGPRPPHGRPADLHLRLLRRNAHTRRVHFALDQDDDVVLVSRPATASLTYGELDQTLAEILAVSESAFEALVHLAYPGVFTPLAPPRPSS
jgi:Putative bacterial sensory transduction regulator